MAKRKQTQLDAMVEASRPYHRPASIAHLVACIRAGVPITPHGPVINGRLVGWQDKASADPKVEARAEAWLLGARKRLK